MNWKGYTDMAGSKMTRIDNIEEKLTPAEYAIQEADKLRKASSLEEYIKDKTSKTDTRVSDRIEALVKEQHPGRSDADINARNRLRKKYWKDFLTRINLLMDVQGNIRHRAETAGLEATIKLQTLLTIILMDSFSRTAQKAAGWIEEYQTNDKDDEENRQIMLDELSAYYVNIEPGPRSMAIGDAQIVFPSGLEEWVDTIKALILNVFRHQAAVRLIQDEYFNGHPILARDTESRMDDVISTIKDVCQRLDEYLDVRKHLFSNEWEEDSEYDGLPGGLTGELAGRLNVDVDKIKPAKKSVEDLAKQWIVFAKAQAIAEIDNRDDATEYLRQEEKRRFE